MRGFLHWMQIRGGNENRYKYVERQIFHFIKAFLKSWLKIVRDGSLLLFLHSKVLIRFLCLERFAEGMNLKVVH